VESVTSDETRGPQMMTSSGDGLGQGVEVSHDLDVTLVRLSGEIDVARGGALVDVCAEALEAASPVVVDLSAVTFMDSVGVSFLVRLAMQAREQGRNIALQDTPASVRELLVLVGALELFDVSV
jgi:anti-anti-sigma factor